MGLSAPNKMEIKHILNTTPPAFLELMFGDVGLLEPPIDIHRVTDIFELVSINEDLHSGSLDKAGLMRIKRDINFNIISACIWINPLEPYPNRRVTIAKFIGHLIYDTNKSSYERINKDLFIKELHDLKPRGFTEATVYRFASQVLIPAEVLKREVITLVDYVKSKNHKLSKSEVLSRLSAKFYVPDRFMMDRLKALEIIK